MTTRAWSPDQRFRFRKDCPGEVVDEWERTGLRPETAARAIREGRREFALEQFPAGGSPTSLEGQILVDLMVHVSGEQAEGLTRQRYEREHFLRLAQDSFWGSAALAALARRVNSGELTRVDAADRMVWVATHRLPGDWLACPAEAAAGWIAAFNQTASPSFAYSVIEPLVTSGVSPEQAQQFLGAGLHLDDLRVAHRRGWTFEETVALVGSLTEYIRGRLTFHFEDLYCPDDQSPPGPFEFSPDCAVILTEGNEIQIGGWTRVVNCHEKVTYGTYRPSLEHQIWASGEGISAGGGHYARTAFEGQRLESSVVVQIPADLVEPFRSWQHETGPLFLAPPRETTAVLFRAPQNETTTALTWSDRLSPTRGEVWLQSNGIWATSRGYHLCPFVRAEPERGQPRRVHGVPVPASSL